MNSFYSTLYGKFSDLQIDQSFSARFIYPAKGLLPLLKAGKEISDFIVKVPAIRVTDGSIKYGLFTFKDSEFGQAAAVRLAVASTCLLSAKSVFHWLYSEHLPEWLGAKQNALRASHVFNAILDSLARQRIRQVQGEDFYADVMHVSDMLSCALLPRGCKELGVTAQMTIATLLLGAPISAPTAVAKMAQDFASRLDSLAFDPSRLVDKVRDNLTNNPNTAKLGKTESGWEQLARLADILYEITARIPVKWHSVYLPYSHSLADSTDSIFQSRLLTEKEFDLGGDNGLWHEIFFELQREEKRIEKSLARLRKAATNLNFGSVSLPTCDYVTYYGLYVELAPQIRRMIDRVRMIKNVLDEDTFQESGNIDLQVAIQAIASKTPRSDIFTKDENLLKSESWTILVDSSLSLKESSKEVKAVSLCLAESAREVMGSNPWGMFAFSDDLYCIKDFTEPYDSQIKARIGGIKQGGLSHIPDALRACGRLIAENSRDRNYLILVSDGIPSGYIGIESQFGAAVKELAKYGVDLAAISVAGSSIKKIIKKAKVIEKPEEIVKEFMDLYYSLSS